MRNNVEELKAQIDELAERGMQIIAKENPANPNRKSYELHKDLRASETIAVDYNAWYSEALPLVRFVLPERIDEFVSYFQPSKTRKHIIYETFRIADYITKVEENVSDFDISMSTFDTKESFSNLFKMQIGIVKSCRNRLESKLNDVKALLQAELFDHELESAKHLHKNNFYRAGGMLAGVVLESHLKSVCVTHKLVIPSKSTISNYNELLKNNSVIDTPTWRHLTLLGDLRNKCSHAKGEDPSADDVEMLIDGVEKIIKKVY